jgi:single-stranded-DNA-specific exonuclease
VRPAPYFEVRRLATELGVSEVLAQVLVRRGFTDATAAQAFLHPDYRVHDPYLMAGMRDARRRLDKALQRGESIAVHGDYDADGVTATFLLVSVLEQMGAQVRWFLPNRFADGYGVSVSAVEEMAAAGVKLLVTVDCGVNARVEVARAQELGMEVIVTDHHELEGELPGCIVVTPKLPGYPCPDLAGVGVAFKLAHALLDDPADQRTEPSTECVEVPLALRPFTDVVAVGTIADVVPLTGENRVLASIGLGRLRSAPRPGLAALLEVAGGKLGSIDAGTVGFRLAPRLNAAGRLEDASRALELLGCADRETALPLALRLNELNHERQGIEAAILAAAVEMVPDPLPAALVLSSPDWHEGVVGIVASRVAERFNRPAILLSEDGEEAKGSGRSIPAFDLLTAVEHSSEHLLAFGGHRAACGLRLRRESISAFREAFVAQAATALDDADLMRRQTVDAVVGGDELTLELADELELLAPHGFGNRKVTLLLHGAEIVAPRLTRDRRHMQYRVRCDGTSCQAIHFNYDGLGEVGEPGRYDVPLSLSKNEYNGAVSAQVEVKALHRLAEAGSDLCPGPCGLECAGRLRGTALWHELLDGPSCAAADAGAVAQQAEALREARRNGRLRDRRGRPAASALATLVAGGEQVLVLVGDVSRRRPLLSDVLSPQLERRAAYVQAACAQRLAEALGSDVVMSSYDVVAARPQAFAAFAHVALLDPPPTRRLLAAVATAAPQAWVHALWGSSEVTFALQVAAAELDLDPVMRRAWRALEAGGGLFDDALEQELLRAEPFMRSAGAAAAALRALRGAGLLVVDEPGGYHLERPQSKVDMTASEAYKAWHTLFRTSSFLQTCLTVGL